MHSATPATFAEYKALVEEFHYHDQWDIRSLVTPAKQVQGMAKLILPASTTITEFTHVFPDQNGYLAKLGRHFETVYVKTIMQKLKYGKCPCFLTLDLCFAGMLKGYSVKWMTDNRAKLVAEQKKGLRRGYQRHVVKICESVAETT